ncbi:MAG: PRTRC system ThiF family protein [Bryobacterales bacterium]|nr:PRTRC system ThiF family protein [Bryobacterales bacterium]
MTHAIPDYLLRQRTIRVVVIGCGGNGSIIAMGLPYIHQALLLSGHAGGLEVTLIDGDLVSPSNCVRQPFCQAEIGLSKAAVLASRINLFWGLQWKAIPENVSNSHRVGEADLVISCVDTRSARAEIQNLVGGDARVSYWLDLGNGSDGGQFVLGQPQNRRNARRAARIRTAAELFPEIVDSTRGDDDTPSCSALEALERQEPFLNQTLASHALALLARLSRSRQLTAHGAFVSINAPRVQPLDVDRAQWKKVRRRGAWRKALRQKKQL